MERPSRILGDQIIAKKEAPKEGAFDNEGKKEKNEDMAQTRRKFLIGLGYAAVGALGESASRHGKKMEESVGFLNGLLTYFRSRTKEVSKEGLIEADEKEGQLDYIEINNPRNFEQEIIKEEDTASVRELVNFNSSKQIELGEVELEKIENYWKKRYEGDKKVDLDSALERMKDWEAPAKEAFMKAGRAYCEEQKNKRKMSQEEEREFRRKFEECFYLSIPESYWKLEADSGVAVGPFQFTSQTAHDFGLKKGENFDERIDPVKSAGAAGRNIIHLYENMNHDWDLVLSGYNGGFVWKFKTEVIEKARNNKAEISQNLNYLNFLKYLEKKINEQKNELSLAKTLTHKVIRKSETLEEIAIRYGISEKLLGQMNKVKVDSSLKFGSQIIIPPTQDNRRKNFYYHIDGYSQNINYPAKLYAALAVLEKRKKETGRDPLNQVSNLPKWEEVVVEQKKDLYFSYTVTKKDRGFPHLAIKFGVSMQEILSKNDLSKDYLLKAGDKLLIRNRLVEPITLATLAPAGKLEAMKRINPAIKNASEPLPNNFMVRRIPNLGKKYLAEK